MDQSTCGSLSAGTPTTGTRSPIIPPPARSNKCRRYWPVILPLKASCLTATNKPPSRRWYAWLLILSNNKKAEGNRAMRYSTLNFVMIPLEQIGGSLLLGIAKTLDCSFIIFKNSTLYDLGTSTSQKNRQTDRQADKQTDGRTDDLPQHKHNRALQSFAQ